MSTKSGKQDLTSGYDLQAMSQTDKFKDTLNQQWKAGKVGTYFIRLHQSQ
jgi:hypothetical protein